MLEFLHQSPEVEHVFNFVSLQMGSDVLVAIKAQMTEKHSASTLINSVNAVEKRFKQAFPEVKWLFFEADDQD